MSRDRNNSQPVAHYNMFPLPSDLKTCFLQCFDCLQMIYTLELRHLRRDLHFTNFCTLKLFVKDIQVF